MCPPASLTATITVGDVLLGSGILVAALAMGLVVLRLRKRLFERTTPPAGRMTIEMVESLYQEGRISKEEFSILRRSVLELDDGPGEAGKSALSPGRKVVDESTAQDTDPPSPKETE